MRASKQGKGRRIISTLMIVIGVLLIAIPLIGKQITNNKQKDMLEQFYFDLANQQVDANSTSVSDLELALEWGADEDNQQTLAESGETLQEDQLVEKDNFKKPIGIIMIDKIDVKLPIAEGTDVETLKFAAGHMPETADLGAIGNCAIAAHRSYTFGTYFNRLNEVEIGDQIEILTAEGETYYYEVYETLLVEPTDVSVLNSPKEDLRVLTLITCDPAIKATHRLIVHAIDINQVDKVN